MRRSNLRPTHGMRPPCIARGGVCGPGLRIDSEVGLPPQAYFDHNVYSHDYLVAQMLAKPPYTRFRCVTPFWDNSARRAKGAWIIHKSRPKVYERWLREMIQTLSICSKATSGCSS
jgi:hypothetical protein